MARKIKKSIFLTKEDKENAIKEMEEMKTEIEHKKLYFDFLFTSVILSKEIAKRFGWVSTVEREHKKLLNVQETSTYDLVTEIKNNNIFGYEEEWIKLFNRIVQLGFAIPLHSKDEILKFDFSYTKEYLLCMFPCFSKTINKAHTKEDLIEIINGINEVDNSRILMYSIKKFVPLISDITKKQSDKIFITHRTYSFVFKDYTRTRFKDLQEYFSFIFFVFSGFHELIKFFKIELKEITPNIKRWFIDTIEEFIEFKEKLVTDILDIEEDEDKKRDLLGVLLKENDEVKELIKLRYEKPNKIDIFLKREKITKKALSEKLKISVSSLYLKFNGKQQFKIDELKEMKKILNLNDNEMLSILGF